MHDHLFEKIAKCSKSNPMYKNCLLCLDNMYKNLI